MSEGKKVLIADDERDVLDYVQAVLEEDGYAFLTAVDGEDALRQAKTQAPDLVILDVQMPKKDGFQVFQELRKIEETKSIPVIMLTAVTERTGLKFDAQDMGEFYGSEPEAYIDKPIEPDKLRQAVRNLIGADSAK